MARPAVFIYTPRCIDNDFQTTRSASSSLRGVFSASRPASYSPSQCRTIASECPTITRYASDRSQYSSDVPTPAMSTTFKSKSDLKPRNAEASRALSDGKSRLVSSGSQVKSDNTVFDHKSQSGTLHTFHEQMSIVPKGKAQPNKMVVEVPIASRRLEHAQNIPSVASEKSKHGSWGAIRRNVSHIFQSHPKDNASQKDPPLISSVHPIPITISSPRALTASKSVSIKHKSSPSMSTQHSRRTAKRLTISPPPRVFAEQQAQVLTRKQRVRSSRSFSGYPNVLARVSDEGLDTDAGLDGATIEAQKVMKHLRRMEADRAGLDN